jgi:hypothetical protein
MKDHMRAFVERYPEGWNHEQWLDLLRELERTGADVSDPSAVGHKLEKTRLALELERRAIPGLGPKRRAALVDRFGSFWQLRGASVDVVAEIPTINRALAEKVLRAIH